MVNPCLRDKIVNGVGKVTIPANSLGIQEWGGVIKLKQIGMEEAKRV
ncbi:MAG: hypothetical protein U5L96_14495 [Owenweeksia sp.]|nr:hypothetical protein [Owenweeksia sp.]